MFNTKVHVNEDSFMGFRNWKSKVRGDSVSQKKKVSFH